MSELKIETHEKTPGVFEVVLEGRLDTGTSPQLESTLERLYHGRPKAMNFDMAQLDYISSVGLGLVLGAMKKLQAEGASFAITRLRPHVKKVFDIVKLLPPQSVFSTTEEADRYFDKMQRDARKRNI